MTTQAANADDARTNGVPGRFWRELAGSIRNPDFWALSSWLDIIVRARKSKLGILWLLAPSIVYVFVLGTFFRGLRFANEGASMGDFYAHVAIGAAVFRTLMSAIVTSANVFVSNQAFIMDGHMRLTDYFLKALAKAFFDVAMYLPAVIVALWLAGGVDPMGFLVSIPALAALYLNALWMVAVFGLIGARLPDLGQLLSTISIFVFLMTPIIWYPEMMPEGSPRQKLMHFNPFFHFVQVIREPLVGGTIEPGSIWYISVMTVVGLAVATLAYRRYARFVPLWV